MSLQVLVVDDDRSFASVAAAALRREGMEAVLAHSLHDAREALALIREACRENGAALLLVSHDREVLGQFEAVQELGKLNRAAR